MRKLSMLMTLVIIVMVFVTTPVMAGGNSVKICVNGKFLYLDTDPILDSGRVFVPINFLAD